MTLEELSNEFDTLVSSYRRFKDFDKQELLDSIEFDEYEKSVWLTKAQEELFVSLYTGKNTYGDSFENTEELRRYLDSLVKTVTYNSSEAQHPAAISANSMFVEKPENLAYIVFEQATFDDSALGCADGTIADVKPVTHDEFLRLRRNPFSGPSKRRVLRLDSGENMLELVSDYNIGSYYMRYVEKPTPIILEDLPTGLSIEGETEKTECALNPMLHRTILENAVRMALSSKIGNIKNS